jgi:acetyl-CoA C-acetyltransferase
VDPADGERIPVLVGAAQLVQRDAELDQALEPLSMLERVARGTGEDARAGDRALEAVDTLGLVQVFGWKAHNGARLLAEALGARPALEYTTFIGGELPLSLLEHAAQRIARGASRVALVAGCNNLRTLRLAGEAGTRLDWTVGGAGEPTAFGEDRFGSSQREADYGLGLPASIYPIFENALRASRGLDLESHRRRMGALMSRFSEVAAANPYAWFPVARSAEEITAVGPENRMIAFPYTKYMNAVMQTDQAAAVLMMSVGAARALGVPEERWVYWWGGAHGCEEAWYPVERPDFASSPSLRDTAKAALAQAGLGVSEIDYIDFYSCFPAAVEMACEMLGIDEEDPRGFTVTGGLPYAGGPGNSYTLHALAAMVERLRAEPGSKGLVTGTGWYLTKHAACVCSAAPRGRVETEPPAPRMGDAAVGGPVEVADEVRGRGRLETYTVLFDREGAPYRGIAVGRMRDGRRFLANTPDDRDLLESFAARENVGREGGLYERGGRHIFDPG